MLSIYYAWLSFDTQDGLYSVAWSEIHENQLATASGDGSIKMWDVTLNVSINESEKEEVKGDSS